MSADARIALDGFPRTWTAEILKTPPLIAPARQYVYPQNVPGEEDALSRGALLLNVKPDVGGNFLATCALGFRDPTLPSGVWSSPSPERMLAVAGGYAYLIDTQEPSGCDFLPMRPVTSVLPAPKHGLLLLAGFHDVLAVGAHGVLWRSERLSWEGVTLRDVRDSHLHGLGWEMFSDQEVEFTVDLKTGAHQGGGYRR